MIRYSSYGGTNYRTNPTTPTKLLCSLATEYRELQDLRERVRKAEAAAHNACAITKNARVKQRPREVDHQRLVSVRFGVHSGL